jgi:F-type H+-transporting ATPase subunit delta
MSNQTLARPYARAAFDSAKANTQVLVWASTLQSLAQVVKVAEVEAVIKNPTLPKETVVDLLMHLVQINDPQIKNFLALLAQYHRLSLLPEINAQFIMLQHSDEEILDAQVVSPQALSLENLQKIKTQLEKRFGRQVKLTAQLDPALIGGVVVRVGDQVIDGSLKTKIADLAEHLLT